MAEKKTYTVTADGWCAGKHRKAGDPVELTERQAQYENVELQKDDEVQVELVGSLDDPTVKKTGLAAQAKAETKKRGRAKK